ncbi:hypothetical protein [Butyrivibrio sp. INlla21]|uniref:hypothetical protein n=1 Tax=Butyrivibrio sp. INlla21 TaxID=1520811 RepID=UPI0008E00DE5|nr:hypothetical protein [Butyrivibrio sp. INlla21]SFU33196.1 hypothetical protein SAMN02910342_00110 [Butyrivibrio sp. INlla21]
MARNKKFKDVQPLPEVTTEKVAESFIEDVSKVEDQLPEVPVEEPKKEDEVEAVVDGVKMNLNIRSKPKIEPNNQIAILGKGTKLIVMSPNKEFKGDGEKWYKVKLSKSADDKDPTNVGYAMKKYIKLL